MYFLTSQNVFVVESFTEKDPKQYIHKNNQKNVYKSNITHQRFDALLALNFYMR